MKRLICVVCLLVIPACVKLDCSQKRRKAITLMNQGIKHFSDGVTSAAVRDLEASIAEDPNFVDARHNLAKVFQKLGRWEDAQRQLVRVTDMEPMNSRAFYLLGQCYQNLERLDMAEGAYKKALEISPEMYAAHFRLGTVAEALDKPREADAAYRKTIEINPRFINTFVKLGLLYLNYDYPDLAKQVLEAGIEINNSSAEAQNALGVSYQMLKEYEKAIASFSKALELQVDFHSALYNLGMTYASAGQTKEAEEALRRFTLAASNNKDIDPSYVRGAQDKIFELTGATMAPSDSALPVRLKSGAGLPVRQQIR
ncbi:MAG: tetratricopeptide repeat protein [Pseudomonadota bacterium]